MNNFSLVTSQGILSIPLRYLTIALRWFPLTLLMYVPFAWIQLEITGLTLALLTALFLPVVLAICAWLLIEYGKKQAEENSVSAIGPFVFAVFISAFVASCIGNMFDELPQMLVFHALFTLIVGGLWHMTFRWDTSPKDGARVLAGSLLGLTLSIGILPTVAVFLSYWIPLTVLGHLTHLVSPYIKRAGTQIARACAWLANYLSAADKQTASEG